MTGTFLKTLLVIFLPPCDKGVPGVPGAGVPTPMLERLPSLRWEAGVAYGGGRRCIAASQSNGNDEASGEPDTRGRLRDGSGVADIANRLG